MFLRERTKGKWGTQNVRCAHVCSLCAKTLLTIATNFVTWDGKNTNAASCFEQKRPVSFFALGRSPPCCFAVYEHLWRHLILASILVQEKAPKVVLHSAFSMPQKQLAMGKVSCMQKCAPSISCMLLSPFPKIETILSMIFEMVCACKPFCQMREPVKSAARDSPFNFGSVAGFPR